jgi:hypothetical protein
LECSHGCSEAAPHSCADNGDVDEDEAPEGMTVGELIAELQKHPETARVRLVVNTCHADVDVDEDCDSVSMLMHIGVVYDDSMLTASDSPPGAVVNIQAREWAVVLSAVEARDVGK